MCDGTRVPLLVPSQTKVATRRGLHYVVVHTGGSDDGRKRAGANPH